MTENENVKICPECGEVVDMENDDWIEYGGEFYHQECFDESFITCYDCGEIIRIDDATWVCNDKYVCNDCLDNYVQCYGCENWISLNDAMRGADDMWYCGRCWCNRFTTCDECNETIWQEDSFYDEDSGHIYCEYCYNSLPPKVIYSYHDFDDYVPRYLNDEDRNEHYKELYGIELEITGSENTASTLQDIMGDNVVLMRDGSVDGYEMITMPMSRQYFYKEFIPTLDKGLKYLRDNGMTGHNGGGIHIHFKELQRGLETANMVNILYGTKDDIDIWLDISQRRKLAMERWCSMTTLDNSPESIVEYNLLSPNGSCNHGTALNYDDRTGTHELRIFNSNLRLERVIKNMECLFALEDYVKQQTESDKLNCTTRGYIDFVYHNKTKYPYIYNFMIEKNIFNKAYEYYNDIYVIEMGNETMTEV